MPTKRPILRFCIIASSSDGRSNVLASRGYKTTSSLVAESHQYQFSLRNTNTNIWHKYSLTIIGSEEPPWHVFARLSISVSHLTVP